MTAPTRLPLWVPHHDGEPAYSLLSRLSLRHGCDTVPDFTRLLRVRRPRLCNEVRRGRGARTVASLAGADPVRVENGTPKFDIVNGEATLFGIVLSRCGAPLERGSFCPGCLEEDIDRQPGRESARPWRRSWWAVSVIQTCPEHRVLLERRCRQCGSRLDPLLRPGSCRCGATWNSAPSPCADGRADRLFIDLLAGNAPAGLPVPRTDLAKAAALLNLLGSLSMHGRSSDREFRSLKPAELAAMAGEGLEVLDDWPTGFRHLLDQLAADAPAAARGGRGVNCYGRLYQRLAKEPDPALEPLRQTVREHAGQSGVQGRRSTMFGTPADLPALCSTAAGDVCGLSPGEVRRLVGRLGVPFQGAAKSRWTVERADLMKLKAWLEEQVSAPALLTELGINRPRLRDLRLAGLLLPSVERGKRAAALYRRKDVDVLVCAMVRDAPGVRTVPKDSLCLPKASRLIGSARLLLEELAAGRLEVTGRVGRRGSLGGICVSAASLRALREDRTGAAPGHAGLHDLPSASRLLGLMAVQDLRYARSAGLIQMESVRIAHRRPSQAVAPSELARFRAAYVTFTEMTRQVTSRHPIADVRRSLAYAGVVPIHVLGQSRLFDRATATRALAASGLGLGEGLQDGGQPRRIHE